MGLVDYAEPLTHVVPREIDRLSVRREARIHLVVGRRNHAFAEESRSRKRRALRRRDGLRIAPGGRSEAFQATISTPMAVNTNHRAHARILPTATAVVWCTAPGWRFIPPVFFPSSRLRERGNKVTAPGHSWW